MCWCWSEHPMHRPTFTQILSILKADSFTNLLATAEVIRPSQLGINVTAVCVHAVTALETNFQGSAGISDPSLSTLMKTFKSGLQVFYGTNNGQCGMLQFQSTGTTEEVQQLLCQF